MIGHLLGSPRPPPYPYSSYSLGVHLQDSSDSVIDLPLEHLLGERICGVLWDRWGRGLRCPRRVEEKREERLLERERVEDRKNKSREEKRKEREKKEKRKNQEKEERERERKDSLVLHPRTLPLRTQSHPQ